MVDIIKNELQIIIDRLMTGPSAEFKEEKKRIEKLWHDNTKDFKKAAVIALDYLPKFDQITSVENQTAFVSGLNLFFLVLADDYFDTLKDFSLKAIQHPDGRVREAIRKVARWLYCSLTMRVSPFVWPKGKPLTDEQIKTQEKARKQYKDYVAEIEDLIDKYDDGQEVEYIEEMKPSVNKSLELLWSELTESLCYREVRNDQHPVSAEIKAKRKEIEQEFTKRLNKINSSWDFDDIQDIIYQEDGQDDIGKIIRIFNVGDISELENVLELTTDAWNYFPHKSLDGKSPMEMF